MAPLLTPAILDRWRAAGEQIGAGFPQALGPGISDDEIDELVAPLDVEISTELRTLWRWGTIQETRPPSLDGGVSWDACSAFEMLPPSLAVEQTLEARSWHAEEGLDGFDEAWLIVMVAQQFNSIVTAGDEAGGAAKLFRYGGLETGACYQFAASLGELFAHWTHTMSNGDVRADCGMLLPTGNGNGDWAPHPLIRVT